MNECKKATNEMIKNCQELKEKATQNERELLKKVEKKKGKVNTLEAEIRRENEDLFKELPIMNTN